MRDIFPLRFTRSTARLVLLAFMSVSMAGCTTASSLSVAPYAIPNERYAAIVVDARSGKVLHEMRADAVRYPASLTKMMTLYLLFEHMRTQGETTSDVITASANASRKPASKLYLRAGETITIGKAIEALAVKSANDVATAVAEHISGTERAFGSRMTAKARSLGMRSTTFRNASGLPDDAQVTTARDMARLTIALRRDYPQYRGYFALRSFEYKGKTIRGHNRVLGRLRGADGMKTGYTRAAGFNLATSLRYRGKDIVAVILGEDNWRSRDQHMVDLVEQYVPTSKIE